MPQLLLKTGGDPRKIVFASRTEVERTVNEKTRAEPNPTLKKKLLNAQPKKEGTKSKPNFQEIPTPQFTGNAIAENQQGLNFFGYGRYDEAMRHFDEALKIDPQMADAWNNKGLSLINIYVATRNASLLQEAMGCIDNALKINPMHVAALNNKGLALTHLSQLNHDINLLNQAIYYFTTTININLQYALAWNNKAVAENIRNQWLGY